MTTDRLPLSTILTNLLALARALESTDAPDFLWDRVRVTFATYQRTLETRPAETRDEMMARCEYLKLVEDQNGSQAGWIATDMETVREVAAQLADDVVRLKAAA